jgi:hypothetical protein
VTFLAVVVAAIAPGSILAVAATTPAALGDTIFFVKLPDNPTIIGIMSQVRGASLRAIGNQLAMAH